MTKRPTLILLTIHFLCIAIWGLMTFFGAWGLADAGVVDYGFFYPWIERIRSGNGSGWAIFYIVYSIIIWLCCAIALPAILYVISAKLSLKISKKVFVWAVIISVTAFLLILVSEFFGAGYEPYDGIPGIRTSQTKLDEKGKKWSKDANNLEGCPILFNLSEWELSEHTLELSRVSHWYKNGSYYRNKIDLNNSGNFSSSRLFAGEHQLYIGPWQSVTLPHRPSHNEEFKEVDETLYRNSKIGSEEYNKMTNKVAKNRKELQQKIVSKNIQETKQIRFLARQKADSFGGSIDHLFVSYLYELQTEENKTAPEKKFNFSLTKDVFAPSPFDLCVVKWTAKFGINAVADCKPTWWRFFTKDALRCTGNIIDHETKEIIAKGVISDSGEIIESRK